MSTARKILWNTFSQIGGKIIISVLGVVVIKLITSYLGNSDTGPYGEYNGAFEFLAFFTIIADLGLYTVGVREMAKDEKKIPMIVGNILTIRTIVVMLMVTIAIIAIYLIPQYQGTRIPFGVVLVGISAILNLITSTISSVLQVHLKMEYNSFASVIGRIIQVAYLLFAIYILYPNNSEAGFYQLIWAGNFGNAIMLGITYYYSRKYAEIRYRIDMEFWKDVIIKAIPYGLALILNTIYFRLGSLLILLIRGTEESGIYALPMRMLEAVGILPLYFMNAILPVLTRSLSKKDGNHTKIIQYAFDFLVMGSMPIVAGTVLLAYPMIYLISTPQFLSRISEGYYGSDIVLQILIFALLFSFINSLFGFVLVADNRQIKLLTRNAFGALLTLILGIIFIPYFGVRAAAINTVITEGYVLIASYIIAKRYIKFTLSFKNTLKIIISALTMGLAIFLVRDIAYQYMESKSILLLIPLGGIIYVVMLFATKTITRDMIALIRKPKGEKIEPSLPNDPPLN